MTVLISDDAVRLAATRMWRSSVPHACRSSFIWLNSTANQCETLTPSPKSDGMNGFELKASLLFFEASEHDGRATQVRGRGEAVTGRLKNLSN